MPIVECGFRAPLVLAGQPGTQPQIIPPHGILVMKGPTIHVEIGFDAGFFDKDPAKVQATIQAVNQAPAAQVVEALIDTGATESCIDEDLAIQLGLPQVDKGNCSGVGGLHELNIYLGHIKIPSLAFVQYGRFLGVKLKTGGQPQSALLGRSILQSMILVYDGRDGKVSLMR
jgi:predicted aspartyl protease